MRLFLLIIFYFICSCAAISSNLVGYFPDNKIFLERFPYNKKSVVIFKFRDDSIMTESSTWCKVKNETLKNIDFCVNFLFSNVNEIVMLEPGTYYLFNVSKKNYRNKKYVYNVDEKFFSLSKKKFAFRVVASEIAYIGDMNKNSTQVSFDDEFLEIKKLLKNKNYEILAKNFANKKQDLIWLAEKYNKNPNSFTKKIARSNIKTVKIGNSAIEKHGLKVINSGDEKDLAELSKSLRMLNNLIAAKKTEYELENIE